mmetsp:Transcript_17358/g.44023  ORF Transcript_17358/g.44023 Transcript_17358/m.44023 type:complete len:300 (-) Transcript_17358:214-1113(-)
MELVKWGNSVVCSLASKQAANSSLAIVHELAGRERRVRVHHNTAYIGGVGDIDLALDAHLIGRFAHRPGNPLIGALLVVLREEVTCAASGDGHHDRASARQVRADSASLVAGLHKRVQVLVHRRPALGLVQAVFEANAQVLYLASVERHDEPGQAPHIEDGVLEVDLLRHYLAQLGGLANKVWNEHDEYEPVRQGHALRAPSPLLLVVDPDLHAAVHGRGNVVRVAFDFSCDLQELLVALHIKLVARNDEAGEDPGDDGRRTGAQAATVWDLLLEVVAESGDRLASGPKGGAQADDDEV